MPRSFTGRAGTRGTAPLLGGPTAVDLGGAARVLVLVLSLVLPFVSCGGEPGGGEGGHAATGGSAAGTGGNASGGHGDSGSSAGGASGGLARGASGGGVGGAGGRSAWDGGASGGRGETSDGGSDAAGTDAARADAARTDTAIEAGGDGGSGGAGSGVGGDGGTPTFNPCPATGAECKIMPLGDSITFGSHSSGGGYRVELFRDSLVDAKKLTFVGRNSNGPNTVVVNAITATFPKNHEGYSGYTIDSNAAASRTGISTVVDAALLAAKPHIVLLMIGTNDVNNNLDLANAPMRLGNLLDRITTMAPNALLVVAKITPTQSDATNKKVRSYNDAIPGLLQLRTSAGKHIVAVDMYTALTANASYKTAWLDDSLHPNDAGYVVMGGRGTPASSPTFAEVVVARHDPSWLRRVPRIGK